MFKDFSPLPQLLANFDSYFLDCFFDRPSLYKVFVMNSVCISNLKVNLMSASLFHCFKFTLKKWNKYKDRIEICVVFMKYKKVILHFFVTLQVCMDVFKKYISINDVCLLQRAGMRQWNDYYKFINVSVSSIVLLCRTVWK